MKYQKGDQVKIEIIGEVVMVEEDVIYQGKRPKYNYLISLAGDRDLWVKESETKDIKK